MRSLLRPITVITVALLLAATGCSSDDGGTASSTSGAADVTTAPAGDPGDDPGPAATEWEAGEWEKVAAPDDCQCSDGSDYHYWVRPADPQKVLFFLDGGGACFSAETCGPDGATYTTDLASNEQPGGGIFDLDNPANPLSDYSIVVAPYCTGDLHLGTTEHDYGDGVVIAHNGYVNGSTALETAADRFPDAVEVVVAGSSAGSASAPAYGGRAYDYWPDAEIAVVADASAAYPGTPAITLAIGSLWGVTESIPDWPETADLPPEEWSLPNLAIHADAHAPDIRFATYNDAYDNVQASFSALIGVDPTRLVDLIGENNQLQTDAGLDIAHWVSPGTEHTILRSDSLYDEEVEGESFVDWLTAFVAGDEIEDVHCVDCQPPG